MDGHADVLVRAARKCRDVPSTRALRNFSSIRAAVDGVTALHALLVGSNLTDALEHLDLNALLGETGEEATNGMRRPAHRLGNLRSAGAFRTVQHGQHL